MDKPKLTIDGKVVEEVPLPGLAELEPRADLIHSSREAIRQIDRRRTRERNRPVR